jgi:hypothetical protein
MKLPFLGLALSLATALAAVAGDRKPEKPLVPPAPPVLEMPEPPPPVVVRGTARARVAPATRKAGDKKDELDGLRAVTLREGLAEVTLAGVHRKLGAGDPLGTATVKAIGADRIVLERPFAAPGGTPGRALVIVTFGADGVPRVRTYVDAGALPAPTPFEEAR